MRIIKNRVVENAERVKELGQWPDYISVDSLISRIPEPDGYAPGFDAGIACCLDLIPRDKQRLSATLHAAYTPEAVEQVRREIEGIRKVEESEEESKELKEAINSETAWWLAACSICLEGKCSNIDVMNQLEDFDSYIISSNDEKLEVIIDELESLANKYTVTAGLPIAIEDGGMAAAYIDGYPFAIGMGHGVFFVGTFYPSLGIPDNFKWGENKDSSGRPMSGPVHGSKQFVKCANLHELANIIDFTKNHLEQFMPKPPE